MLMLRELLAIILYIMPYDGNPEVKEVNGSKYLYV